VYAPDGSARELHVPPCHCLALSADGRWLAGAGSRNFLLDLHAPDHAIRSLPTELLVWLLAFGPDQTTLFALVENGPFLRIDADSGAVTELGAPAVGEDFDAYSVGWLVCSADGQWLALPIEGLARVCHVPSGAWRALPAQVAVSVVALTPDGRTCAGGGAAGEVVFWDLASGEVLGHLSMLPNAENWWAALAFSQDGETLVVATTDGLRAWPWRRLLDAP
jgi:WD40 repeat protein